MIAVPVPTSSQFKLTLPGGHEPDSPYEARPVRSRARRVSTPVPVPGLHPLEGSPGPGTHLRVIVTPQGLPEAWHAHLPVYGGRRGTLFALVVIISDLGVVSML